MSARVLVALGVSRKPYILLLLFVASVCFSAQEDEFVGLPRPGELKDFLRGDRPVRLGSESEKAGKRQKKPAATSKGIGATVRRKSTNYSSGRILKVGPGKQYSLPSMAADSAQDGDVIEIDASGDYRGDLAVWKNDNLHIRGVNGRPVISGRDKTGKGRALWVIAGNNITVENIEFAGNAKTQKNMAGIYFSGGNLDVRYCYFHNNHDGIVIKDNPASIVWLEYNEFSKNGSNDGRGHNISAGRIAELTVRFNYIHHGKGHNLETAARYNRIHYNRIMDEKGGMAKRQISISNAGIAHLVGNVIQQGKGPVSSVLIRYGAGGKTHGNNKLVLVHNTLVSAQGDDRFIELAVDADVMAVNNIFFGKAGQDTIARFGKRNLVARELPFRASQLFDYHLKVGSPAIDKALILNQQAGSYIKPDYEYVHKAKAGIRHMDEKPDYGAFEFFR